MAVPKKQLSKIRALLTQAHTLHSQHQYGQAAKLYEKLLKIAPRHPDALNLLGLVRYQQGRLEEAGKLLEQAIRVDPDHKQAWLNYGNLRQQLRDLEGAMQAFQQVLRIDPNSSFALLNIGNCLRVLGRYDEADAFYLRSLAVDPTFSLAWANLGKLARTKGQWERAMKTADAALDCPDPAPLGLSLWIEVHHLTKPSDELAQRAEELLAHPGSTGELLAEGQFFAHHIYGLDPQVLLQARDRVQQQIEATVEPGVAARCPAPRAEPLTLGFISSAFRQHPVAFMALGALEHLRQQGFRVCIYSGRSYDDAYAQRFRACADEWRDISQLPDVDVVELMRADGVDVLFDMSGVTNHGRPRIPAMRAAPLQIKWVGGQSGPSGIPNMDAFLTDAVQSPAWADADHRERLLRMPHGYVTYTPPIDAPEPAPEPPVQRNGFITFGSLNKLAKLSTELLQAWAQILRAVPDSRLLLRAEGANEQVIQDAVAKVFEANGVSRERLSFEGPADHREFLDTYSRIDIALDSFPYTGGLTTCEAMWMGVPVVALAGRFFCERHAATHLHNVGLGELVAASPEEYAAKAIALAQDHQQITRFRSSLRDRVKQSPLCDYQGFAADLAKLVREEWVRHVADEAAVVGQEQVPSPDHSAPPHEEGASELADAEQAPVAAAATPLSPADIAAKVERACELAERLLIDQQPQKALELCQSVSRLDSKNPKVLFLLGMAQAMSGDTKAAVKPILEALNLEPSNEVWWRHAADVFATAGYPQDAEFALDRAAAIPVASLAGQLKDATPDKLASTIDECEAALRDNPSDVVAFFMLTHALLAQENATSQQPALESALRNAGWLEKLPLYAYWFDYIERANHIEAPRISVIVISNEPEDNMPEAMRRLREQVGDQGEIIFVNNGCNDEVFDCIRPHADVYIRLKANSGAYCARNIGAVFGRANILLFVEDDGVPEEGFIDAHLQIHENYDVIAVRGVYQPSAGSEAPPHYRLGDEPFATPCNLEGNASYQAQAFYKVGGWADWILFGHGGVELASRLLELISVPEKQIYHPDPVLRHDYFLSEEHLRKKHQRQNVSWHLISSYRPSWNAEFWRWESEHRGALRRRRHGNPQVHELAAQDDMVPAVNGNKQSEGDESARVVLDAASLAKREPIRAAHNGVARQGMTAADAVPHASTAVCANPVAETALGQQWNTVAAAMLVSNPVVEPKPHGLPEPLIVSLTSYPKRFGALHLTLLCLLRQTVRPDKLILWIAENDKSLLPKQVLDLQTHGLEICYCEDIKSYKKIIPTLRLYPNAFIVTADDDLYYAPIWLELLIAAWEQGPDDIIAHRAHRMRLNKMGNPLPYMQWERQIADAGLTSEKNFATSGAGVLYPPGAFHSDVIRHDLFMRLCPTADDVWLYWMTRLKGRSVRLVEVRHPLVTWPGTQNDRLWNVNITENDKQIAAMIDAYSLPLGTNKKDAKDDADQGLSAAELTAQQLDPAYVAEKLEKACGLAERLLAAGQPQQALALCESALRLSPENPVALFLFGLAQAVNGDPKAAVGPIRDALQREPSDEAWWRHAADVFAAADLQSEAEDALDRATCLQMVNYAQRLRQGPPDEVSAAVAECERALRDNPHDIMAHFVLTHALLAQGRAPRAEPQLEAELQRVGWVDKQALYRYWIDGTECWREVCSPQISIIITSDRHKPEAAQAMRRLREQSADIAELIFVNNGRDDGETRELINLSDTYVHLKGNAGPGSGRNLGALFARAPVLLFVDDDVVPEDSLVASHLRIHAEYDVVAVRGADVANDGSVEQPGFSPCTGPYSAPCDFEGNVSFRAEAFYAAGGWADWLLHGPQGMELAGRLLKVHDDPTMQIYHPAPKVRRGHPSHGEEHLLAAQQRTKVATLLITCYQPEWDHEFWRWAPEHRGDIRIRDSASQKIGCSFPDHGKTCDRGSQEIDEKASEKDSCFHNDVCEFHYEGCLIRFWLPLKEDHIHRAISINRCFYEQIMLEDIRGRVGSGAVLVDVGANIGNHAIYFGKICKASKVYAFEPQSEIFRILERNILINDLGGVVRAHCIGLSESAGSARLGHVRMDNWGMTKLEVDADGPVKLAKLDDFFLEKDVRVDVLKVDVEGMECDVLRGASRILREHGPLVYAEAGTDTQLQELHSLLKAFGYQATRRFNATPTYLFEKLL